MVTDAKYKVAIYHGWCKKCGICAAFCPRQVLGTDEAGYPVVKDISRCTGCDLCVDRCPDFAIAVLPTKKKQEIIDNGEKKDDGQSSAAGQ